MILNASHISITYVNARAKPPERVFRLTLEKSVGHSFKNLGPFQKTLRPPWCSKLVTGLHMRATTFH